MNENDDPYKILGVAKDATQDEIKKAYRKLALKFHPDKYANQDPEKQVAAQNEFAKISAANEILSDPEERWQHDMRVKHGSKPGTRFQRPANSNCNDYSSTTYDDPTPNQSTGGSKPFASSPTSSTSQPGMYKVTKTTYDSNGNATTTTFYTNEPPSTKKSTTTRTVPQTYTTSSVPSNQKSVPSTSSSQSPGPYKVTKTTYDENGIPHTTTFYSNEPPSSTSSRTTIPVSPSKTMKSSTAKSSPSPSPYTVTKTTYDENGAPKVSTYFTDSPPPKKTTTVTTGQPQPTVTRTTTTKSQQQPLSMSSSSRIVRHPDGSSEVITTTTTMNADGSSSQSSSSQRFPPGVTPVLSQPGSMNQMPNMSNMTISPSKVTKKTVS